MTVTVKISRKNQILEWKGDYAGCRNDINKMEYASQISIA